MTLALLAEYAVVEDDGKLHILAGGLEQLVVPTFPFVQNHLALVLKIAFESTEWERPHVVQIQFLDEGGAEVKPPHAFSVLPQPPPEIGPVDNASSRAYLPVVHNMRDVTFGKPGHYVVSVTLPDGEPSTTIPLEVIGPLDDEKSLQALLSAGYNAFVSGDLSAAWAIFDQVVRTHPDSAFAHNDFGFVSLGRGRAADALQSFERARQLGFQLTELTEANVACCQYLLGDFRKAFANFRRLMGVTLQSHPSVLYAIDRNEIRPIQLTAAVHFVSLMALNAGYSAFRSGAFTDAVQFGQIATAGTITFTEQKDAQGFVAALDHLMDDCRSVLEGETGLSQPPI